MKRSEMVDKMIGHFRGAQNLGNEKAIFSYVLNKMEEAGMEYINDRDAIYHQDVEYALGFEEGEI